MLLILRSPTFFIFDEVKHYTKGNSAVIFRKGTSHIYGACNGEFVNDWVHFEALDDDIIYLEKLGIKFDRLLEFQSVIPLLDCVKHVFFKKYSNNKNAEDSTNMYLRLFF